MYGMVLKGRGVCLPNKPMYGMVLKGRGFSCATR